MVAERVLRKPELAENKQDFLKLKEISFFMDALHNGDGKSWKGVDERDLGWFEPDFGKALPKVLEKYSADELKMLREKIIPLMGQLDDRHSQARFIRSFMMVCQNLGNDLPVIMGVMDYLVEHCREKEDWANKTLEAIAIVKQSKRV